MLLEFKKQFLHSMRIKKGRNFIEADLEKAYDRPKWNFIEESLQAVRFNKLFMEVIMSCIGSSSMRILVNGFPTNIFSLLWHKARYHFSFFSSLERLGQDISNLSDAGIRKPKFLSRNGSPLTHVFLAEDLIPSG